VSVADRTPVNFSIQPFARAHGRGRGRAHGVFSRGLASGHARGRGDRRSYCLLLASSSSPVMSSPLYSSPGSSVRLSWSAEEEARRREIRLGKRPVVDVSAADSDCGIYIFLFFSCFVPCLGSVYKFCL
jgi:hypothetical protein